MEKQFTECQIVEKATQMQLEYMRKWRAANKDKVRENTKRYWMRKAEEAMKEERNE